MESEYIALSDTGQEACWLQNLCRELGFPQILPMVIRGNNEDSMVLTHNPQFHQCSKHIVIRHHWVWDLVSDKKLNIQNCCGPEQTADILTKALPRPKFVHHREEMGLQSTIKKLQ